MAKILCYRATSGIGEAIQKLTYLEQGENVVLTDDGQID